MKPLHVFALVVAMAALATISSAKQPSAVDGINRIAEVSKGVDGVAFSPAAVFFTLVMVGELDSGGQGELINSITRVAHWRSEKPQAGGTSGWRRLDNTWWTGGEGLPSNWCRDIGERYRTQFIPGNFKERYGGEGDRFLDPGLTDHLRMTNGVLLTEASYSPDWKYAMRRAIAGVFYSSKGKEIEVPYIQSHIIPATIWGEDGEWFKFSIDLSGGGKIIFELLGSPERGGERDAEAIVFLPELQLLETLDSQRVPGLAGVAGEGIEYNRVYEYEGAPLSKWLICTKVDFQPQIGADWSSMSARPSQPVVLRVERPFTYKVIGSHGETVVQGTVIQAETETKK